MSSRKTAVYIKIVCIFIHIAIIMTGCWDMRDIDKRLFVGSVGIDSSDIPEKHTITFSLPVARMIAGSQEGAGGGGGEVKPVMLESTVASSVTEGATNLALRLNRELFFEHMRIVIIGEDAAKQGLNDIIDPFFRQTEFNRRSRIAIAEGEAKKTLEINPWPERLKAEYLETIFLNQNLSGKFYSIDLGRFMHNIHATKGNSLVSKISPNKEEVSIGGAAVIKNLRLVGWLSEEEIQGINLFLGELKGGSIEVNDSDGLGKVIFSISRANRKIKLVSSDPIPEFHLKVEVTGNVTETEERVKLDLKDLKVIEDLVSGEIKSNIIKGARKLQKDYKVDLLNLCDYMYKYHPKLWKSYQKRWEEIFPNVKLTVDVNTVVTDIGVGR
jgi:spore germination protein KC